MQASLQASAKAIISAGPSGTDSPLMIPHYENVLSLLRLRKTERQEPIQQIQRVFGYTKNADGEIVPDKNADRVLEIFEMAAY